MQSFALAIVMPSTNSPPLLPHPSPPPSSPSGTAKPRRTVPRRYVVLRRGTQRLVAMRFPRPVPKGCEVLSFRSSTRSGCGGPATALARAPC